ncbi:uncharacterized protein LOC127250234 [Andrographis paniculata]|uniref:uncharacterized protein LOC127250234 n=1 Tax=Andrographis paniculata TaxID=175694 RepID=UPI0021E86960|nr:uncharacterized protein LOC127250234 [Andrographis paniculata]XP_051129456.1 uncharacterized protein LOC127250234 [Andrographis paniculata]
MGVSQDNRSRDHHLRRSPHTRITNTTTDNARFPRNKSRFCARWFRFKKLHYLHTVCSLSIFFACLILLEMLLPGFVSDDDKKSHRTISSSFRWTKGDVVDHGNLSFLKELDFGDDVRFGHLSIDTKFQKRDAETSVASRKLARYGYRKPALALVFADLLADPHQIQMVTVATALVKIGYEIQVFSLEDGPVHAIWTDMGFSIRVIRADESMKFNIDWLNYDSILVNSLKAVGVLYSLMQEPFKCVPLVWNFQEQALAERLRHYVLRNQSEQVENWRKVFHRATAVVFPNYFLPMAHSTCDPGNFAVIPGSPMEAWKADRFRAFHKDNTRLKMSYGPDDFVVTIVGSQLLYGGQWLEHALVLKALYPVFQDFNKSDYCLKVIILAGDYMSNYSHAVETVALNLKYPSETVKHVVVGEDADAVLSVSDLVIYGSFLDEHIFPGVLLRAMCLGKLIVAPDLPMIVKYVTDKVTGYVFPKEDIGALTEVVFQLISYGSLSISACNVASFGFLSAKNLMISENVEGYASLLENILMLPSEVELPRTTKVVPSERKVEWQWHRFEDITSDSGSPYQMRINTFLDRVEEQFNCTHEEHSMALGTINDTFVYNIWEEQKYVDRVYLKRRREEEELKDRTDQPLGTWDDIYKSARRPSRILRERDDGELERTGQPLCIYEPYFGEGTWPFLHHTSLYRGIGLSSKGRRPGADDIDAPSCLPLLNNSYYRDVLGEYGAFFSIANKIDHIHKNAWIGFQSWRATARKESLSKTAEISLLNAIESRQHGDTLYFWVRLDMGPRDELKQDFWLICDGINAGNCRYAFMEALKKMYGIKHNSSYLPPMPLDGGLWSALHTWALPTKSFLEFVMFSRMFVDALDAQFYDLHRRTGKCCLSFSKGRDCYSRLLELLINVWAYHSARKMVYIDPVTGLMQQQHVLNSRRGVMWVKWFDVSTLKSMDEELAEEYDSEQPQRHWLWPSTGQVFWQGMYEKERDLRNKEKERKKQKSKERIERMKRRAHRQKALGKYMKPRDR